MFRKHPFLFFDNFGKSGPIFIFVTIKFRKDLQRALKLKLIYHLPSNLLPHYLAKHKGSTIQLYIQISETNMLHVIRRLFHEFLFVYLFFLLPDTDVVMNL